MIERIVARIGVAPSGELWSGDDAAVISTPGGTTLWTTDGISEGVDFELHWARGADVGWKAIAVNVSDVAAMGGRATRATVVAGLDPSTPIELFEDLLEGLATAASRWEVDIVGGDISRARALSLTVSMLGECEGDPVLRSGAGPGDAICVTGTLGGAAGGLALLRAYEDEETLALEPVSNLRGSARWPALERLVARQLRPVARLEEGRALADAGAKAMIDISDGLAIDLDRLMAAGDTGCEIDAGALPLDPDLTSLPKQLDLNASIAAIGGGEDYELLCCVPEEAVSEAAARLGSLGTRLSRIGTVTAGERMISGKPLEAWKEEVDAWDHLHHR